MLIFFISFSITLILIKCSIPLLKKYFSAIPNIRSSHLSIKPSGAGIIVALITTFFGILNSFYLPLIAFPLAIIGFIDDKLSLPRSIRFGFQILTSIIIIGYCRNFIFSINSNYEILIFIFQIIFITSIINFLNFMDGLDGMLAGNFLVFLFFLILFKTNIYITLFGSLCAFLVFNWSPSKVFLGDSGSTFLGAFLSGIILSEKNFLDGLSITLLMSPLLLDAFTCVIRRYFNGQKIFKAHKLHIYQRLNQNGLSHDKVSLIYISKTFILSFAYFMFNFKIFLISVIFTFVLSFALDRFFAAPFRIYDT